MSIGSSLSGINFSGLSSGIDSNSIISRLMEIESIPIRRYQAQQAALTARMGLYSQLKGQLQGLQSAISGLDTPTAFQSAKASFSAPDFASVSVSEGASVGNFALKVNRLATAHKVMSSGHSSPTAALGFSGKIELNGKQLEIKTTDSLKDIATRINDSKAGVKAAIIDGGAGKAYLSLTSEKTGAANKINLSNVGGTALESLGLRTRASQTIDLPDSSNKFTSQATPLSLGNVGNDISGMSFDVEINGQSVHINADVDSLSSMASKINAANAGVTASIVASGGGPGVRYELRIASTGTSTNATIKDPDGLFDALGFLVRTNAGGVNTVVDGQDSSFSIDGIQFTNESNTIANAIPGVSLTLLKPTGTTDLTLSVTQDTSAMKSKVKDFMNAYNQVVDFIKQNSAFNKETFQSGGLFGDSIARQIESSLSDSLLAPVAGITAGVNSLGALGFTLDEAGKLKLDESMLDNALSNDPNAVGNMFRTIGTSANADIEFVSSGEKTRASGNSAYQINITQAATKTKWASDIGASALGAETKLTFKGRLFNNASITLNVAAGTTRAQLVDQINSDARLKDLVSAKVEGGKLVIESKKYGTPGDFDYVEDSGPSVIDPRDPQVIGPSVLARKQLGLDVAGTINGEAATGSGQFLTGNVGNTTTDGLQIIYKGTATGAVGDLKLTKGVASVAKTVLSSFTDTVNGLLSTADKALQEQFDSLGSSITSLQQRLVVKQQFLQAKFTRMEETLAKMQSQQARLSQLKIGG